MEICKVLLALVKSCWCEENGESQIPQRSPKEPKDNPGGGSTDADPSLSNKVNLDGSSANDNPGSRDFNTLHQLASSNTKASRFSLIISVTKAPLNEPTIEVMNTTMDTVSFGTLLMDDPGGFWPNGKGCAIYDYDYDVYRGG